MAASLVEGDWNNFTFKILDSSNFPEISKHLRTNFYLDEPVIKTVGPTDDGLAEDFDNFVATILDSKLSFGAYDKTTGKLVGVRITLSHGKDFDLSSVVLKSAEAQAVLGFIMSVDEQVNLFEHYGVDAYADLLIASVDRDFRQQGLATEMYKRTLAFLKASGLPVAKSVFTSPYTRIAAKKFDFEELGRRSFREIQNLQGEFLRPNATDEEFAAVMARRL